MVEEKKTESWVSEQKKEDIFEEIIYKSKHINLTHLRRVGWNGFPDRLRAPCWQLLLQYLPTSPSKQRSALRRKRNEYHKHIIKHYFEFDFCLTDRKLPTPNDSTRRSPARRTSLPRIMKSLSSRRESMSKLTSITTGGSRKKLERTDSTDSYLLPLFSQTSKRKNESPNLSVREDSLLLQIREDLNSMVKVATKSSSISSHKKKSDTKKKPALLQMKKPALLQIKKPSTPLDIKQINGGHTTTNNRLFSNNLIKESLERIIYLWATRNTEQSQNDIKPSEYTSRYIPEIVDIVYPLYLTNLHGYIWDNHVSTTMDKKSNVKSDHNKSQPWLQNIDLNANGLKLHELDLDEIKLSSSFEQPTIYEDEDRQSRIKTCEKLAIGVGIEIIPQEILEEVEADTYWCLENFMTAIQDYRHNHGFTKIPSTNSSVDSAISNHNAPGLQKMIALMEKVVQRVDVVLYKHLKSKGVEFIWFTYRWLNSLHVRVFNERCIIRLWDTCMCEETDRENGQYFSTFGFNAKRAKKRLHLAGFLNFQVYICAALLHRMRKNILAQNTFEEILFELRNPPLDQWGPEDIDIVLSQAYVWSTSFHSSEEQIVKSSSEEEEAGNIFKVWSKICHWPPRKSTSRSMTVLEKSIGINPKKQEPATMMQQKTSS